MFLLIIFFFFRYIWAGLLIVLGIYLNVLGKTNHFDLKMFFMNSNKIFGNLRKRRKSPMIVWFLFSKTINYLNWLEYNKVLLLLNFLYYINLQISIW